LSRGSSRHLSSTTSTTSRVRVPQHVARLVTWLVAPLVVDFFAYVVRLGASAHRAARHAAHPRLLPLRRVSGCLGTSRGSSHGSSCRSSSTTSTTPRVQVPRHIARLVTLLGVDFFAYAVHPGASARRAARCQLLCLRRASGCLGTSHGSSHGSSSTTLCVATSSCSHTGSTSATPCVVTTCLVATLTLLRVRRALPQRRLPVASRRPFISTSFQN
jgi:hypothetical protein